MAKHVAVTLDGRKLRLVADQSSHTGYSFKSLECPESVGIPATVFEVALWQEVVRLSEEINKSAKIRIIKPVEALDQKPA